MTLLRILPVLLISGFANMTFAGSIVAVKKSTILLSSSVSRDATFNNEGTKVAISNKEKEITLFSIPDGRLIHEYKTSENVWDLAFNSKDYLTAIIDGNLELNTWTTDTFELVAKEKLWDTTTKVLYSSVDNILLGQFNTLVFDNNYYRFRIAGTNTNVGHVKDLEFNKSNPDLLLVGFESSGRYRLTINDTKNGFREIFDEDLLLKYQYVITTAKFSVDGSKIIAGTKNGDIYIFDTYSGELYKKMKVSDALEVSNIEPLASNLVALRYLPKKGYYKVALYDLTNETITQVLSDTTYEQPDVIKFNYGQSFGLLFTDKLEIWSLLP